jgi:AraC-like DNA-binding protein
MSTAPQNGSSKENIPFLWDLDSLYKHLKARPPLDKDFDIREIDPEVLRNYDYVAHPFRHSFYCVTLFLQGDITLSPGFWKTRLSKPAVYFKTPYQVVSWRKPEKWLREYFIVFTEAFMRRHKALAEIIYQLPFFHLDKAVPLEVEAEEQEKLLGLFKEISAEYRSDNKDKFEFIASYVHTLLISVRRIYNRYSHSDKKLVNHITQTNAALVDRFRLLIQQNIGAGDLEKLNRSIKYYAGQLSTHPNHLNAVVKRFHNMSAIAFMHKLVGHEAKVLLSQTALSVKEIAYRLGFIDTPHLINFFKKQEGITPTQFRKDAGG